MAAVAVQQVVVGNASLYVGDLDRNVDEAQIYDIFSRVAPVVSLRVCRDQFSRISLGYAYVNFASHYDAALARETLNFTSLNGRAMRIMYSHRDPSIRKSGFANIYIKNLDSSIDNKALFTTFSAFGNVLSCKVATDNKGSSKGYGFVQYDNDESAQQAIHKLNGMLLNNKKVYVGLFIRRHARNMGNGSRKFTNLYVKNLLESTTDEELRSMFGRFGAITSVVVMREADGQSRCFGFVNFETTEAASDAVNGMNGTSVSEDRVLYVARAQKKAEREAELRAKYEQERRERFEKLKGANLYLKNLEESINEERVEELFAEFGTITSSKILRNAQGISNGVGFVAFSTSEEAAKALTAMNGKLVGGKPLYVAVAQRKADRRAQLQAQFALVRAPFSMPAFHPGASRLSPQQLFYGQGMPGGGYGFQTPFLPGMGPTLYPNYFPYMQQYQQPLNGLSAHRRGGTFIPQQWMLRQNDHNDRQRISSFNGQATSSTDNHRPSGELPMSSLASATLENQHKMLGEQLFPLVQKLEEQNAGKLTGMLLEMDQTEVLHLIESPEALQKKVSEAVKALNVATISDGGPGNINEGKQ